MVAADVFAQLQPSLLSRARGLTASPEDAEDLVQEAWVRFLRRPPRGRSPRKLLQWFSVTMYRLAVDDQLWEADPDL